MRLMGLVNFFLIPNESFMLKQSKNNTSIKTRHTDEYFRNPLFRKEKMEDIGRIWEKNIPTEYFRMEFVEDLS